MGRAGDFNWTDDGKVFFKEGHDEGWRHYVVRCFDGPKTGILIMTNSANGEDLYNSLLENLLRDTLSPLEWEGFRQPFVLKNDFAQGGRNRDGPDDPFGERTQ